MKHLSIIQTAVCAALLFAALSPRAVRADEWNKRTIISFAQSVQVPGTTLPAGTYVFKLADSVADRCVVQIFNERENHVYASVIAIRDYRSTPPDTTQISFYEAPVGQPEPIKAWFYPGDNVGREFVYSGAEAAMIAQNGNQTVRSGEASDVTQNTPAPLAAPTEPTVSAEPTTDDAHAAEPAAAPVVAEPQPSSQEAPAISSVDNHADNNVDNSDHAAASSSGLDDQQPQPAQDGTAQASNDATSLPATGSELPLAGLMGLSAIAAALAIRAARTAS